MTDQEMKLEAEKVMGELFYVIGQDPSSFGVDRLKECAVNCGVYLMKKAVAKNEPPQNGFHVHQMGSVSARG